MGEKALVQDGGNTDLILDPSLISYMTLGNSGVLVISYLMTSETVPKVSFRSVCSF